MVEELQATREVVSAKIAESHAMYKVVGDKIRWVKLFNEGDKGATIAKCSATKQALWNTIDAEVRKLEATKEVEGRNFAQHLLPIVIMVELSRCFLAKANGVCIVTQTSYPWKDSLCDDKRQSRAPSFRERESGCTEREKPFYRARSLTNINKEAVNLGHLVSLHIAQRLAICIQP
ncbi:hypothetical protein Tco_0875392 [Tanacetum coccineum]|uniref:Uncharacterized protein n=1 Tax=Tanacetum coccineum TaxID=301880 RepID=A0ABQ5BPC0_9ASTR